MIMGTVNVRSGMLYLDFTYRGKRCKEQTKLNDNIENRNKLNKLMSVIEKQIHLGIFDFGYHFPSSKKAPYFKQIERLIARQEGKGSMPFHDFASMWFEEKEVEWRKSHIETVNGIVLHHLLPTFGEMPIGSISKADILAFRLHLVKTPSASGKLRSASRNNHILVVLRMILNEAAERFGYVSPWLNIKALSVPRTEIQPFSLDEVQLILSHVREDFRSYFLVRFFTGLRTGEIDGLMWKNIELEKRKMHIHQSWVRGQIEKTKTSDSYRTLVLSERVYDAFCAQWQQTGHKSDFVFCDKNGHALNQRNLSKRVWYPLLNYLGLEKRNPYQTRHTAATLWLASGENPEWIARQLGHANTSMLFRVYSRYVPDLRRKDGEAFESFLSENK